jgi:hypothetical protein
MRLPDEIREQFRRYGREGGRTRARKMDAGSRAMVASRAAAVRWTRQRFGGSSFSALGLPGAEIVDTGLADLAAGKTSHESLLVSLAAPRLRREGVPVGFRTDEDPEIRLYDLLAHSEGDLAHARYTAYLRRVVSFADACRVARIDRG